MRLRAVLLFCFAAAHFSQTASAQPSPAKTQLSTVVSNDGTRIGVECAGSGPMLLFVHGGVGDRTRWVPMFPLLAGKFTVCAMDRRGRGASGDSAEYSLAKEAEDVAAVAASRPGPVYVFGHSYGGVAALEAAFLTDRISALMLYEPPLYDPADDLIAGAAKIEALVNKGDLDAAVELFEREIVKLTPEEIARMKSRPSWASLVKSIKVHPRQMRALAAYRFEASRMKQVKTPVLLLVGEETASPYAKQSIAALRESLPNSRVEVLAKQEHNAMEGGREALAAAIVKFAAR
jgi:pimeloyl-ACP methyl ester carboxylesterase